MYKDLPLLLLLLFLLLILISSHPAIPSHPIPAHLISSHAIPHPITSHPIPSHPIPPHSPFPSGTQFRKINNFLEAFSDPLVYFYHMQLCSEELFFATSKKCVQKIPYRTWDAASSGTRLRKATVRDLCKKIEKQQKNLSFCKDLNDNERVWRKPGKHKMLYCYSNP